MKYLRNVPNFSFGGPLSTTSSNSVHSANASFEKPPADDSGQQSAGEEELADVVYESSCQMEVKEYEMGKHLGRRSNKIRL